MNPDFLKKLAEITAALRGGITLGGDPLGELQKRATQIGEDFGTQLEQTHAQAGYAKAHPQSMRAQQEMMTNMAMLALQMGAGGKPGLASEDFAAIKVGRKMYRGSSHWDATQKAIADGALPGFYEPGFNASKIKEGFVTADGKYVSRTEGYKIQDAAGKLSKSVKAQIATREQQGGRTMGLTAEDVKGRLYANKGTKADAPMTLADMDRIVAKSKARKAAAMDSVVSIGSRLHDQLTKNGGFTIDPATGADLTSGYSVGGGEKSGVLLKKPLVDLKPKELQSFLDANKDKLQPGQAWGGWVDNGHVYVEPADQVGDLNAAQRLGNERGEKAIWDHANKAEIPLKVAKQETAAAHADEWSSTMDKWRSAFSDFSALQPQLMDITAERRKGLADALRNPSTPESPWLSKYIQRDIERPNGASPQKIADVEGLAYDTFKSPQFKKWLEAGRGTGNWYDTRKTQSRAIDALGDKLGPEGFNQFIDHLAASTAMSNPANNIRRASWWRALNLQGLLNPEELRSSTLAAPEGMGHIAQKAHHFAMADLVENGKLNVLANPKPGSFAENLKMNWRPVTFDSRMAEAALDAKPKMSAAIAGDRATPRKWAYAPIERAAQRVAGEQAKAGNLGELPAGVDPTAAWQAQVWHGINEVGHTRMMSQHEGTFNDVLDRLLRRSAEKWGVSPAKASELFWKGQPLDLPLDASLLKGPAKPRKK